MNLSNDACAGFNLPDNQLNLAAVIAVQSGPVAVLDQSGCILAVSEGWRELAGRACLLVLHCAPGQLLAGGLVQNPHVGRAASDVAGALHAIVSQEVDECRATYLVDQQCYFFRFKRTVSGSPRLIVVDVRPEKCDEGTTGCRELSERFQQMAENVEEIFWIVDPVKKKVLYLSPAFEKVSGLRSEEAYGDSKSYEALIHPEDRLRALAGLQEAGGGREFEQEFRIVRPDGSLRWLWNRCVPLRDAGGKVYRVVGVAQDVTSRKEAEDALRKSEDRNRDLVENSRDLLCTHDLNGRLLSANPLPAGLLGYTVEELLRIPMRELVAPEFRARFDSDYLERIRRDGRASGLLMVVARSGERRIWAYDNTLRTEGVHEPVVRGMARDVTEQRRAEEALRLSEEKFAKAFHSCPSGIAISTLREGLIVDANESFEQQTGYRREELIGRRSDELGIWADPGELSKVMATLDAGEMVRNWECSFRTRNGRLRTVLYSAERIKLEQLDCVLALAEDMTERKQARESLLRSEANYRALVEGAPYGMLRVSLDGRLLMANPALLKMLGFTSERELASNDLAENIFVDREELPRLVRRLCRGKRDFRNVFLHWQRKNRHKIVVRASGRLIDGGEDGAFIEATVEDVTEMRRALAMEELSAMAVGFTHTFHQGLATILGVSELLLLNQTLGQTERRQIQQILAAGVRARSVTRKVMELWQKPLWDARPVILNEFAFQMKDFLRPLLPNGRTLETRLDDRAGAVLADPGELTKMTTNLVNYVRNRTSHGVPITLQTMELLVSSSDPLFPDVAPGFYGALAIEAACSAAKTRPAKGRRMDDDDPVLLPIQLMVEHNGGYLRRMQGDGGSERFDILLPSCEPAPELRHARLTKAATVKGDETILLVEFDDVVMVLAATFLEAHGYSVVQAKNADQALKVLRQSAKLIDLIVADEVTYQCAELEFSHWHKKHPETRLLLMSGFPDSACDQNNPGAKRPPTVERPFLGQELLGKVREILGETNPH